MAEQDKPPSVAPAPLWVSVRPELLHSDPAPADVPTAAPQEQAALLPGLGWLQLQPLLPPGQ